MLNKIILIVHEGETMQHAGCAEDAVCVPDAETRSLEYC
jgi:hypothetical protein